MFATEATRHTELRRLLAVGIVQADAILDGRSAPYEPLRSLAEGIRVASLGAHERHRAEIEALAAWPAEADDPELAQRFDRLARHMLRDMARAERPRLGRSAPADLVGAARHAA